MADWRRRTILGAGVLATAGWVWGLPRLLEFATVDLEFEDIPDLSPYRRLKGSGPVSGGGAVLIGLQATAEPDPERMARLKADLCRGLFGPPGQPGLPVAYFSDFNCPNCRVLEQNISEFEADNPGLLRLQRHELPLLGEGSAFASRAVLAADLQGKRGPLQERLLKAKGLINNQARVLALAGEVGLDVARLKVDMAQPPIAEQLADSRALAAMFGFYGTPSTVIGRSAFIGVLNAAELKALIHIEGKAAAICQ